MGNDSVFFKGLATETLRQAPMSIWVTQIRLGGLGTGGACKSWEKWEASVIRVHFMNSQIINKNIAWGC